MSDAEDTSALRNALGAERDKARRRQRRIEELEAQLTAQKAVESKRGLPTKTTDRPAALQVILDAAVPALEAETDPDRHAVLLAEYQARIELAAVLYAREESRHLKDEVARMTAIGARLHAEAAADRIAAETFRPETTRAMALAVMRRLRAEETADGDTPYRIQVLSRDGEASTLTEEQLIQELRADPAHASLLRDATRESADLKRRVLESIGGVK